MIQQPPTSKSNGEGVLIFPSKPKETYRYTIKETSTSTTIWMEHRASKLQWECVVNDISEYAPKEVCIPIQVVVSNLKGAFKAQEAANEPNTSGDESDSDDIQSKCWSHIMCEHQVDLVEGEGKKLMLEFVMTFGAMDVKWAPVYLFNMTPVPIQPTDILASQLRDIQEEVEALKLREKEREERPRKWVMLELIARQETYGSDFIIWDPITQVNGKYFEPFENKIWIVQDGIYEICISMDHSNHNNNEAFRLLCAGEQVETCVGYTANGGVMTSNMSRLLRLKKNQDLQVQYTGNGSANVGARISMSANKSSDQQHKESPSKPRPPLYSVLLCSKECASGSWIHWDYLRNDDEDYVGDFVVLYDLVSVTIHEQALVQVNLSIDHNNTHAPVAFELQKVNQKGHVRTIQMFSAYTSHPERYITTNASVLLKMKQHEQIRVKYVGAGVASTKSRLSLVGMQMHFD